jgi:predicted aspartyl protease
VVLHTYRPTIPITIGYKTGRSINIVALIDSGSDESYLPMWVADFLGIKLSGKVSEVETINGMVNVYQEFVNITIRHKDSKEFFTIPVDIPCDENRTDEVILGRKGFFDRFDITFKENSKRLILVKSIRG